jgi:hypothetical protein
LRMRRLRAPCSSRLTLMAAGLGAVSPLPAARKDASGPPRFLCNPRAPATPFDYGGTARPTVLFGAAVLPTPNPRLRLPRLSRLFAADQCGPRARCLRFAAPVTRRHARLASGWGPPWPVGISTHWVASRSFSSTFASTSLPLLPGLAWRTRSFWGASRGAPRRPRRGGQPRLRVADGRRSRPFQATSPQKKRPAPRKQRPARLRPNR